MLFVVSVTSYVSPALAGAYSVLEMSKEVPGGSKPLRSWERWYWGVAVVGISIVLYSRLKPSGKTPEQLEVGMWPAALACAETRFMHVISQTA